jgi:type II secretory pathway pseudopilin PulG
MKTMGRQKLNGTRGEKRRIASRRRSQRGYALISLLAGMTISLIILAAAAPSIKHETQRELEEEMFWRGQQVANAIVAYRQAHGGQFPTKLDDLADNFTINGKPMRFLRPSALRDPMTKKGEWKAVHPGDPLIAELALAVTATAKQPLNPGSLLAQLAATQSNTIVKGLNDGQKEGSSFFNNTVLNTETGPIVGVVSRSPERTIRNYFGIETYDHCLFIQGIPVPGLLVIYPAASGGAQPRATPGPDGKCPPGVVCIDPNCTPDMQRSTGCVPFGGRRSN